MHPRALARAWPRASRLWRRRCPLRCASTSSAHRDGATESSDRPPRIVVAMSGGVDSSVAAHLLQRWGAGRRDNNDSAAGVGGLEVVGLHMSNWNALDEGSDGDGADAAEDGDGADAATDGRRRGQNRPTTNNNASSNSTFCEASEQEYSDALSVATHLSVPLHRASFAAEYWVNVFAPFVEGLAGTDEGGSVEPTTPNPDFGCNAYIKFGAMREYAMERMGADWIATGHYARLWHRERRNGGNRTMQSHGFYEWMEETSRTLEQQVRESVVDRPEEEWLIGNEENAFRNPLLLAGADKGKDQSYFLSGVKTEAFRNVLFPLGHLTKSQTSDTGNEQSVRDIAREAGLPTASKRDSTGICFVGKRNFGNFVSQYLPEPANHGSFVDVDTGEIVGGHDGAMYYTMGQGAKISGAKLRYFVCGKKDGDVFVCNDTHHPALYADELFVDSGDFNWIGLGRSGNDNDKWRHIPRPLVEGQSIRLWARTRHLQPLAPCTVTWTQNRLAVHFERPMRAITPGQILALYAGRDGLICLGGGPIRSRGASLLDRGVTDIALSRLHPSGHNDLSLSCSS